MAEKDIINECNVHLTSAVFCNVAYKLNEAIFDRSLSEEFYFLVF